VKACSPSRLFPPRNLENGKKAPDQTELNRGRVEQRELTCEPTTPSTLCFPGAEQIGKLTRRVQQKDGKTSVQTVYVLSSLPKEKLPPEKFRELNRRYWKIESDLHYRLDNVLDEDRSRVRNPRAAHVLGMFRRVCVSLAIHWCRSLKGKRLSTRAFLECMTAHCHRKAWLLLTSAHSNAWLT